MKILISEYDFAVNVVMVMNIAIQKAFISDDSLLKEHTIIEIWSYTFL